MGVAALVLGIVGLVFCLIPTLFGVTQIVAMLLGIIAVVLGVMGRKQSTEQGLPTGTATAGMVLGIVTVALAGLLYASCMYCARKVGQTFGEEINKQLGSPEFKRAMQRAREEQHKGRQELEQRLRKRIDPPGKTGN